MTRHEIGKDDVIMTTANGK